MSLYVVSKWDTRFLDLATVISSWSKDPSTKVGAVIVSPSHAVVSMGFNGFPAGMPDHPELFTNREEKYSRIIHGEMNALLFAPKPLPEGCTLYTVPFMTCDRCVVHMLQAGIRRFVAPTCPPDALERWGPVFDKARTYIRECGGTLIELGVHHHVVEGL
jgi:dCMP deaminase